MSNATPLEINLDSLIRNGTLNSTGQTNPYFMADSGKHRNPDGTFKEGHPGAKPKGAVSEKTRIWNEISDWFKGEGIEKYQELLMSKMKSDDPKQKEEAMKRFEAMLEYFQPKLARTELKNADDKGLRIKVEYVDKE